MRENLPQAWRIPSFQTIDQPAFVISVFDFGQGLRSVVANACSLKKNVANGRFSPDRHHLHNTGIMSHLAVLDAEIQQRVVESIENYVTIVAEAERAADYEKAENVWSAMRTHRKALAWSMLLSTALIMEGYDTLL